MKLAKHFLSLLGPVLLVGCSPQIKVGDPTPTETPATEPIAPPSPATATAVESAIAPTSRVLPATATSTPHPASGATIAALKVYPDLGKKDSMFNRAFRDLYEERKSKDPVSLTRPDWPLVLAKETAKMLSDIPPETKAEATSEITPAPSGIAAIPAWFKERIDQPSALNRGAYDQKQAVYPRRYYYYSDSSGRFWIDIYGSRHYY